LKDSKGRLLADVEDHWLYQNMANKSSVAPTVELMRKEMKRRAVKAGLTKFRKNSCSKQECIKWLKLNPVTDFKDICFLQREEFKICVVVLEAHKESQKLKEQKRLVANWTGNKPWLRLYCCVFADQAITALKCRDDKWSREMLDGRNLKDRPPTYWEVVAGLYNDDDLIFYTEALGDLHHCFKESIRLVLHKMPGGELSVEDCKKKISQAKTILTVVSYGEALNFK